MREQNKLLVNNLLVAFLLLFLSHASIAKCTTGLVSGKAVTFHSANADNYAFNATGGSTETTPLTITDKIVPTLSIIKTKDAAEPSTNGTVTISTEAGYIATKDIIVSYTIAGTAVNGTDYTMLNGLAIIPAGANSVTLPVNVIDNFKTDGTRTVILTLESGSDGFNTFIPGADYSATVNIADNDVTSFQAWKVAILPANNVDGKIQPGEIITYKIYVRNTTNTAIGPLMVTDKIPANTNWESGWQLSSGVVGFPITSVAANGITEVTFQVKTYENLEGVEWINNTAYVSDGTNTRPTYACDPKTGSCDTITRVPVRASKGNLTIRNTILGEGPSMMDDYITYKLLVKNAGRSNFTKLEITDSLPYNLDLPYQTTATKGTAVSGTSPKKVSWHIDKLEPGDSVVITLTSRILSGEKVVNTSYVYAAEGEEDYSNNISINTVEITNKSLHFINAFRPGGVQNNKFVIVGIEKFPGTHLVVYSRLGNIVYESNSYNNDWTADNIAMGEYLYKVIVPKKTGKTTYSGSVLIIK
ncbi:T9SS type B sorting domain-containing protein [Chitinophaga sancti]|uniref:Conserved repeat domain-containing protein n=1 Tax=Chitinophaga sancti TaxID=1004 RepID=A0A1K1R1B4_9BACT|nr:gliding motility-associated C-terminal domain-containing protein [Chitinophaga sancti]WQD64372.1 gliding motility-associated C-terminal domain-containing protein [Chitinophaga sancti]WQG90004.1 gliding motility-associated C-terminal domain-containing protein [Chitinophaga sancti]SFW65959.1 conserved repeat domain-containing protein [Chitinophaga sancti]